uniref:Macaca fascicularis brain cDNA, clone: QmoA-10863 n=1 Tax=Macaca fascicularis TaxID=9541 RepID=I7GJ26_MACFA|nr:unnamed protein product [Macaca fascicularis]
MNCVPFVMIKILNTMSLCLTSYSSPLILLGTVMIIYNLLLALIDYLQSIQLSGQPCAFNVVSFNPPVFHPLLLFHS